MKKIALTGHSKGIGKATYDLLQSKGYAVEGFSRSNGWDFTKSEDREEFVKQLKTGNYDCFINNAYPHKYYQHMEGFFQVELLNEAWLVWEREADKTIIVIGNHNSDNGKKYYHPYSIHKRALDETCVQLRGTRHWPHIINIKPSYVDTQVIDHLNNVAKLSPSQVAELILWSIESPVKVYDLSFGAFEK